MDLPIFYNHQFFNLLQALPFNTNMWLGFGFVAVLTVILVATMVYMLSNIIGSARAKQWSRFQIYEAALSLLLLFGFSALIYLFFLNPQTTFGQLNIVSPGCTTTTQIFTLASCDLSQFTTASVALVSVAYYVDYFTSFIPGVGLTYNPIPTEDGISLQISFASLIPPDSTNIITYVIEAIFLMLIINQMQLILVSGAVLFLAVFLCIGLIARTVGFTRTFGGAMIAFGLGIGIVYPLLVAMTYGFIDVHLPLIITCASQLGGLNIAAPTCIVHQIGSALLALIINPSATTDLSTTLGAVVGNSLLNLGYVIAGLTIIPLLNFAIVDAFIIDFSSAIGERMSFSTLFQNFI